MNHLLVYFNSKNMIFDHTIIFEGNGPGKLCIPLSVVRDDEFL